jgi:predicted Fe-S protein YdhL (DUF1289 family)
MTIASPCTSVCQIHEPTGWCLGCGRTLAEIASWSTLDDSAKLRVWRLLPARRAQLPEPPPPRPLR